MKIEEIVDRIYSERYEIPVPEIRDASKRMIREIVERAIELAGMTDDEIDKFRTAERARMQPMREAARKEAFVQGYLVGRFQDPTAVRDEVLFDALPDADEAYARFATRGPA